MKILEQIEALLKTIEGALGTFSEWLWGTPILILLVGGGLYLTLHSGFIPFKYLKHAFLVLTGKYDKKEESGQISHFEALSQALASTVGMGNISGVAIAVVTGGPGAIFWMWVSALVGMATKFYTCSLAIMFRGKDSNGEIQGGPMYVIETGMPKYFKPLAYLFAAFGIFGVIPSFQSNQLTQVLRDVVIIPNGWATTTDHLTADYIIGIILCIMVSFVIFGGLKRIAKVASKMVPAMIVLYVICVTIILLFHLPEIPSHLWLIIQDAFTGEAVLGGALGTLIITGVRRAAFSNEAGTGTAPMVHGAAKTDDPIKEGLVGMLGPGIDTLVVCTMTALAILMTDVWQTSDTNGVSLTLRAFQADLGVFGTIALVSAVLAFSISSLFAYSYYGTKCTGYLLGANRGHWYNYFYIVMIMVGCVSDINLAVYIIDAAFAMMAIPTMLSSIYLAPQVKAEAKRYFARLKNSEI